MTIPLRIRGILHGYTGYAHIAERLGMALEKIGYTIEYEDYAFDNCPCHPFIEERMITTPPEGWVLHIACPDYPFEFGLPTIAFTMMETTRTRDGSLGYLNGADVVVVPCEWNAKNFKAQGLETPIRVCPLGVDPDEGYMPSPIPDDGPTIFGMAARLKDGGCRKGLTEGTYAFLCAFPNGDEDVELRIKVWPDDLVWQPDDPRVKIDYSIMTPPEMARWTSDLTCLLVPSKGEAWGLHTLQAMAAGRPVIASLYGGTAEFFDRSCGESIPYLERPAGGFYRDRGDWCLPSHEHMVAAMRTMAENHPTYAGSLGQAAAKRASGFTWSRSALRFHAILLEAQIPSVPKAEPIVV